MTSSSSSHTDYGTHQYEALRQEAVDANPWGQRGHGLSLFLTRGMTAWFNAVTALMPRSMALPSHDEQSASPYIPELAQSVRSELTLVLADMILTYDQEHTR